MDIKCPRCGATAKVANHEASFFFFQSHVCPVDNLATLSQAIQQALALPTMREGLGYVCTWAWTYGESGDAVVEYLKVYGIDLDKLSRRTK